MKPKEIVHRAAAQLQQATGAMARARKENYPPAQMAHLEAMMRSIDQMNKTIRRLNWGLTDFEKDEEEKKRRGS